MSQKITVVYGDGIGPEIMTLVLEILKKAGAHLNIDVVELGEKVYQQGHLSGIRPKDWDIIRQNKILLKAPISTPQGKGYKSLNVKIRKSLGLFANVRPIRALSPYIKTKFPDMDLIIIRENEEDLYAGIEHRQTHEVFQCLKLISLPGTERICRYAFEYARQNRRKKITCMTKDNIMKLTDGTFRKIFNQVAKEYPDIENEHWIIDIGSAKFAVEPSAFDVILLPNLYGDILSDVSAQLAGSVGIGGSSNIGLSHAMFEAIHGSAPRRAGQNVANPSGLLHAALLMLNHIGEQQIANKIYKAWLKTIEEGIHTYDIYNEKTSRQKVSTTDFGKAVIENLGGEPKKLELKPLPKDLKITKDNFYGKISFSSQKKVLDGIDVFICEANRDPVALAKRLQQATQTDKLLKLSYITNRGIKVFPNPFPETFSTDHWRCRFLKTKENIKPQDLLLLLQNITSQKLEIIKTENLYSFNKEAYYSQIG